MLHSVMVGIATFWSAGPTGSVIVPAAGLESPCALSVRLTVSVFVAIVPNSYQRFEGSNFLLINPLFRNPLYLSQPQKLIEIVFKVMRITTNTSDYAGVV